MLQLTAAGRDISVLPEWLLHEEGHNLPLRPLRIGTHVLHKSIHWAYAKVKTPAVTNLHEPVPSAPTAPAMPRYPAGYAHTTPP